MFVALGILDTHYSSITPEKLDFSHDNLAQQAVL
tara:strand:- start:659 stop:760 length:102 start_codon:yes stop_codon:yes gene_type:complete